MRMQALQGKHDKLAAQLEAQSTWSANLQVARDQVQQQLCDREQEL